MQERRNLCTMSTRAFAPCIALPSCKKRAKILIRATWSYNKISKNTRLRFHDQKVTHNTFDVDPPVCMASRGKGPIRKKTNLQLAHILQVYCALQRLPAAARLLLPFLVGIFKLALESGLLAGDFAKSVLFCAPKGRRHQDLMKLMSSIVILKFDFRQPCSELSEEGCFFVRFIDDGS
jgi:hypothetical protein